jgi:hypothetical protein
MKKLITIAVLAFVACSVSAANWKFDSLLSGVNVLVPTNSTIGLSGLGINASNVLYTTLQGQIVYSYSNNVAGFPGGTTTNGFFNDAFSMANTYADVNGDINANASVWVMIGNTNLLPIVCTNSTGQLFVPAANTNGALSYWGTTPTVWPLSPSSTINWMYPATTNTYPSFTAGTNAVVVTLYRESTLDFGLSSGVTRVPFWETSSQFSFTCTASAATPGSTPYVVVTNLPTGFLQSGRIVGCTVTATPLGTTSQGVLLNQIGILQPIP